MLLSLSFLSSLLPSFSPYLLPSLLTSFLSFLPPSFPSYLLPFLLTSFLSFLPPSFPSYLLPFLPTSFLFSLPTAHADLAQYRNSTQPLSRDHRAHHASTQASTPGNPIVRDKWKRAAEIAKRAENDDTSSGEDLDDMDPEEREIQLQRRRQAKAERENMARTMGMQYFLEMVSLHHCSFLPFFLLIIQQVDQKHRYGSSLRKYHKVWQESESAENFFYWLDYGEGKHVDLPERPRSRLDEERVRYLSREERLRYLVTIDDDGKLCWAKNGQTINTSPDWKDSMDGIVPIDDHTTPTWRNTTGRPEQETVPSRDSDSDSDISTGSGEDASRYVNQELHDAKGLGKLNHLSTNTIMNNLLR
jgi:hypothetical protein